MKLAYSTLGSPNWTWDEILDGARRYGYAGIELRLCAGEIDLIKAEPFATGQYAALRAQMAAQGVSVACLGSSCRLHEAPEKPEQMAHARAYIELAAALGAPYVRVFPDRLPPDRPQEESFQLIAAGLDELAAYGASYGVSVLVETHGDLIASHLVTAVMSRVTHPCAGLLWDAHHTWRFGGETPSYTWSQVAQWVRHLHLKDSRTTDSGYRYTLFGEGEYPAAELLGLLAGYDGWIALEHELKWHPDLEPPEVALPWFSNFMRNQQA